MDKILFNSLKLAYSPLCNRDFTILKKDEYFKKALEDSSIYIIAQRPEIYFDNVISSENGLLTFEIRQKQNDKILLCKIPIFQEYIATDPNKDVILYFGFNDPKDNAQQYPVRNVSGIKFYQENQSLENFLIWFSPEKFLQNYWKGYIDAEIEGDLYDFTKYNVHYVGQSTKQTIWKRLTGHNKLQDILSLENPFTHGSIPTHEIAILCFSFEENIQLKSFDINSSMGDMVDSYLGKNFPNSRTISLDVEKALIKAIQPKYNDELFNNYPKSIDGLYQHAYDKISYTFIDPITLNYENGTIKGGQNWSGDAIIIKDNISMELYRP